MGITLSQQLNESKIHCEDIYYIITIYLQEKNDNRNSIKKLFINKRRRTRLFEVNDKNLNNYVTTKKEKEKIQKYTKMPKAGEITVKDYLYGSRSKIEVNIVKPK